MPSAESGLHAWPRLAALVQQAQQNAQTMGAVRTGVVYPLTEPALRASVQAHDLGLIQAVLYAPRQALLNLAATHSIALNNITIVDTPEATDASDAPNAAAACAAIAVAACKTGDLKALMKGSLHTDELLGAVVARETGLRTDRRISHAFVFDVPRYHKLLFVADAVVNIAPDLKTKQSIVQNAIDAAQRLGVTAAPPKVAIVTAVEVVQASIPATLDAAALVAMAADGRISGGIVEGPFGMDNALSAQAAAIKGMVSQVAGDADILIAPDLNAGNMLYKTLVYLAGAQCAGVVLGAQVPIILTSRADSEAARIASCAMASLLA
jgi:phosphate acetyltransferase